MEHEKKKPKIEQFPGATPETGIPNSSPVRTLLVAVHPPMMDALAP